MASSIQASLANVCAAKDSIGKLRSACSKFIASASASTRNEHTKLLRAQPSAAPVPKRHCFERLLGVRRLVGAFSTRSQSADKSAHSKIGDRCGFILYNTETPQQNQEAKAMLIRDVIRNREPYS